MNDQAAIARHIATPHISAETFAYYAGRAAGFYAADFGTKVENTFSRADLRAGFARGVKDAGAEVRLNLDAEWD
jgi:hypothetical protein